MWHKTDSKKEKRNSKLYISMREYGIENFKIVLIENYPCENKQELLRREEDHRKEKKASLNTHCCYLTEDEKNKKIKEKDKKYREKNKDKIKEYYENNKDKIKEYYENNKDKIKEYKKEYRGTNKDKITEYNKEYYEINKEKLKEKYTCECGGVCVIGQKKRHFRSLKHQNYLKSLEI